MSGLVRRKRLNRVSPKTLRLRATRRAVVEWVTRRDRVCQAWPRLDDALARRVFSIDGSYSAAVEAVGLAVEATNPPRTCGGPLDVHEVIPRSAWAAGQYEASNCLLICRRHHDWIDDNPDVAHTLGLHGFSWERP